jgi:hypothetical protein
MKYKPFPLEHTPCHSQVSAQENSGYRESPIPTMGQKIFQGNYEDRRCGGSVADEGMRGQHFNAISCVASLQLKPRTAVEIKN